MRLTLLILATAAMILCGYQYSVRAGDAVHSESSAR